MFFMWLQRSKKKKWITTIQRKNFFVNRLKYAEKKITCVCIDGYKIFEGVDFNECFEILWGLKKKKINIKEELVEMYENMNAVFAQNHFTRTTKVIFRIEHVSITLMKWMA